MTCGLTDQRCLVVIGRPSIPKFLVAAAKNRYPYPPLGLPS